VSSGDDENDEKPPRKERVLHTRVPAVLEQELKRVANAWRVPVSNVVRALLEDALDTLDIVGAKAEDELRGVAEKLQSERHKIRRKSIDGHASTDVSAPFETRSPKGDTDDPLDGAVGVTPITLAHDTRCALTGDLLSAGTEAYMVLFDDPRRKLISGRNPLLSASTSNQENADD
jgi:hypothetical protein